MRLTDLTADQLATIQMVLEEGVEHATAHLEWLDTDEGRKEDNRDKQRTGTEARIAVLRGILGSAV